MDVRDRRESFESMRNCRVETPDPRKPRGQHGFKRVEPLLGGMQLRQLLAH